MKKNYDEGTWFAVPLEGGGFGVGVIARKKRTTLLCYFFGPVHESVPKLDDLTGLRAANAVRALKVGDLGLHRGRWPVIGKFARWDRTEWPMPAFIRREILPPYRNWVAFYSDADPTKVIEERPEATDRPELENDSLCGAGFLEAKLTSLLKNS